MVERACGESRKMKEESYGMAYGFMNWQVPKEVIEGELPLIIKHGSQKIPSNLELLLIEGVENLNFYGDEELGAVVEEVLGNGAKYAVEARLPGAGNKDAAEALLRVFYQARQTELHCEGDRFECYVAYHDGKHYVSMD